MKTPRLVFLKCNDGWHAVYFVGHPAGCGLYDHNLLNMQPVGLESVELERKLLSETNQSVWYALSIANSREELLARKEQFLRLPSVEPHGRNRLLMLPADHDVKRPLIEKIGQQLATLPERPPLDSHRQARGSWGRFWDKSRTCSSSSTWAANAPWNLEQIRDRLRGLPVQDCNRALSQFQQQMAGDLLSRLHTLHGMANPEPPKLDDLPKSLVDRFVGQHGKYLLKIYGRGNIWDMQALSRFVHEVRTVDDRVTGNPLQAYEASLEMKHSYEDAAVYALIVIVVVLVFDFRSVRYAMLAGLPLALGVLQMFGLMGLLNIPLNPANMIALPLILGIGVDYGVHIVHDYIEQRGRYRMAPSTAVAVLVDALTTIVGFGALMIASHQGLQSLGRVLSIGVTCCLFTSIIMLPALLTWMSRHRTEEPEEVPDPVAEEPPIPIGPTRPYRRVDAAHPVGNRPHTLPSEERKPNSFREFV